MNLERDLGEPLEYLPVVRVKSILPLTWAVCLGGPIFLTCDPDLGFLPLMAGSY
jgi:hypothetical protein